MTWDSEPYYAAGGPSTSAVTYDRLTIVVGKDIVRRPLEIVELAAFHGAPEHPADHE